MTAHTPGPWRISLAAPYMHFQVSSEDGIRVCMTTDAMGFDAAPERREANARLIAAAPEMLAALSEMLDRYTGLVNSGDAGNWDPETEPQVIAARAVVAKTTRDDA